MSFSLQNHVLNFRSLKEYKLFVHWRSKVIEIVFNGLENQSFTSKILRFCDNRIYFFTLPLSDTWNFLIHDFFHFLGAATKLIRYCFAIQPQMRLVENFSHTWVTCKSLKFFSPHWRVFYENMGSAQPIFAVTHSVTELNQKGKRHKIVILDLNNELFRIAFCFYIGFCRQGYDCCWKHIDFVLPYMDKSCL